jgi:hypothetical protein
MYEKGVAKPKLSFIHEPGAPTQYQIHKSETKYYAHTPYLLRILCITDRATGYSLRFVATYCSCF